MEEINIRKITDWLSTVTESVEAMKIYVAEIAEQLPDVYSERVSVRYIKSISGNLRRLRSEEQKTHRVLANVFRVTLRDLTRRRREISILKEDGKMDPVGRKRKPRARSKRIRKDIEASLKEL